MEDYSGRLKWGLRNTEGDYSGRLEWEIRVGNYSGPTEYQAEEKRDLNLLKARTLTA